MMDPHPQPVKSAASSDWDAGTGLDNNNDDDDDDDDDDDVPTLDARFR